MKTAPMASVDAKKESTSETKEPANTRLDSFKSWITAGFNIGWDLGQGLVLFIPKGLLQPFSNISPTEPKRYKKKSNDLKNHKWWSSLSRTDKFNYYSKNAIQHGILTPAVLLANYLVSPLIGALMAVIAMIPGLLGGLIFNQKIRNQEYHYAMDVVNKYSATAVWGALGMSALLTFNYARGGFGIGAINIPSISLYLFSTPAISMSPLVATWVLPLVVAYGLMVMLSVGQSLNRIYSISEKFATYSGESLSWRNMLKGTVDVELKDEAVRQHVNDLFSDELKRMSSLYTEKYDRLRQTLERDPTSSELAATGVLTQYQLMKQHRTFIRELKAAPDVKTQEQMIQAHRQAFEKKYKGAP